MDLGDNKYRVEEAKIYIKKKTQTYVVGKRKSTMLFFGGAKAGCVKMYIRSKMKRIKRLKTTRHTHKETLSPRKHIREKDA